MNSYLFSVGNTNTGNVGACMRIKGENKADALERLQNELEKLGGFDAFEFPVGGSDIEYLNFYLNPGNITVNDVELWSIEDEDGNEIDEMMFCPSCNTVANPIAGNVLWCPKCGFQWTLTPEDAKRLIDTI